ncbi:olfactory receptor 2AT4-like [Denticeps clupeoides]|uniref:olfactory receptor 2AT4-like n=1 Tax=Denticeps clupeoides TaxID=299321 RepID=UPI0010A3C54F|nr:olfactory receptor 2AT4-like [Denticeps clupeoides]
MAGNQSFIKEFVIVGFPGLHPDYFGFIAAVMFLVYLCILIGNAAFLTMFATNRGLHKPMYVTILNLVVSDVLFSTTTLPKIISRYWFRAGALSFNACFVQMYLVHYFGNVNAFILLIMAVDRYVAICHPLRYPMLMTKANICILSATAWLLGHAVCLMIVIRAYPLPYCAANTIIQCYCDHVSITSLACTDRALYSVPAFIFAMVVLLVPLAFIVYSYIAIIVAVFRIATVQGRLKTLSTCTPQLIIIVLYFLPRCFVYLAGNIGITFNADLRIAIIMMYSLLPPMINPLIYCLRTEEIKNIVTKGFSQFKLNLKDKWKKMAIKTSMT